MTKIDNVTLITYAGLLNALIDVMENDVSKSMFNRQHIKYQTKNLLKDLKKIEDALFPPGDHGNSSSQYIDAGTIMLNFFRLGVALSDMDPVKSQGLQTQMNILLKNYGVDLEF